MVFLIATAKATNANSYCTVARADEILGGRPYTTTWDNAAYTPDAEGYVVGGTLSVGDTQVVADLGVGTWTKGSKFRFDGYSTVYTISSTTDGTGIVVMEIAPALREAPTVGTPLVRISGSQRERGLIWATRIFDELMVWYGTQTTAEQRLDWPRVGVWKNEWVYFDDDTVPELLETATAEFAQILLARDRFAPPGLLGLGMDEVKVEGISVKISSSDVEPIIPDSILSMLDRLGTLEAGSQGSTRLIPLGRS